MLIRQICGGPMGIFCYIVQDPDTLSCALIDPAFSPVEILGAVEDMQGTVTHVINTHGHADHTCGNRAIMEKTQAALYIHKDDARMLSSWISAGFSRFLKGKSSPRPHVLLSDDDVIEIGSTNLKVIHTPGHSPGGICLLGEGNLFTGDTLFVGAIGATWFPGASHKLMVRSIKDRLLGLPPETRVYPGHHYGVAPESTIGQELSTNPYIR